VIFGAAFCWLDADWLNATRLPDQGTPKPFPIHSYQQATFISRQRWLGLTLLSLSPLLGLGVRFGGVVDGSDAWRNGAGGFFWTLALYGLTLILTPRQPMRTRALVVALAAAAVELSQLWHPVWLEAMRAHPTILLLIGQTFDPYDWVSCGLGLIMGMAIERKFQ